MTLGPPPRIETERLVLRPLEVTEAELLQDAIDASLDELRVWMPWAASEPKPIAETRDYIERSRANFDAGEDYTYPILNADETEVLGSTGLHPRCGEGCIEIGYWLRSDRTGRGYATEVVRALTCAGLGLDGVERVILRIDVENEASLRIPERLGFTRVGRRAGEIERGDGELRDAWLFEMRDVGALL